MPSSVRVWTRRLLLVALSTGVALAAAEAYWRAFHPGLAEDGRLTNMHQMEPGCHRVSPTLAYEPIPGACGRDEQGFLDAPSARATGDALRILLLGDSVSVVQRGWVHAIETRLAELTGRPVVIFNAGVGGYDTCQEAWQLRARLDAVDPDLVLQQVCHNDLPGSASLYPTEDGRLVLRRNAQVWEFPAWIVRSHLLLDAALRWNLFGGAPATAVTREEESLECLRGMVAEADRAGVPLVSAHFPVLGTAAEFPGAARDEQVLLALHREAGVNAVELRPLLEARVPLATLRNHPMDPIHVGGEPSHVVGTVIAEQIHALGVVAAR